MEPGQHHVLVVDDDEAVGKHAAALLRSRDYRVSRAATGAEALESIARAIPDVIVLDHYLPDTSGEQLLAALRADPATRTTPVIYLTIDGSRQRFRRSMVGGADDFLSKPFKAQELSDAVAAQLRKHYARMIPHPAEDKVPVEIEVARLAEEMRVLESRLALAYEERRRSERELSALNASIDHEVERKTRALERQNSALKAYGYAIAHELKRPLRGILGFAGMLMDNEKPAGDAAELLARIQKSGRHMNEFIEGLLALAEADRGVLERSEVDLSAMAREIVLANTAGGPPSEARIADGLVVHADPVLARVILQNLLSNAIKYSAKNPHPRVEFDAVDINGERVFFARDNGAGFDMHEVARLFEPFQRLHASSDYEGIGIGLATVKQIVERHGGRIWAKGEPGEGASFFFTLPSQEKRRAE